MAVLDRNFGVFNAATGITVARSSGAYGTGTVLAVALFSNITWPTPSGWALRTQAVNNLGLYSFDRTMAGESSVAFTPNAAGSGVWFAWEMSAGSAYVGSSATEGGGLAAFGTPNAIPTAGNRHLFATIGGVGNSGLSVASVSNSFANLAGGQSTTQDRPFAARADRDVTADGVTGYSTTGTFAGGSSSLSGSMILAYSSTGGGADTTPPSVPTGLAASNLTGSGMTLTWSPSSDDVSVAGYDVQIINL